MAAPAGPPPAMRNLRVWQQNLNRSLHAQLEMLSSLKPHKYDIALIQEPYTDFRGESRTNSRFTSVYPTPHVGPRKRETRSLVLVNTRIPSSSWSPIPFDSPDITAIELRGEFGIIRVINIYNDCEHNDALTVLVRYLRDPANAAPPGQRILYIWGGDFNRHHPFGTRRGTTTCSPTAISRSPSLYWTCLQYSP